MDLLHEMSAHYNHGDASDRDRIRHNLVGNMLGANSGVRLILALDGERAVGLASAAILYPAVRERGQLFLKELYVIASHRGRGIGTKLIRYLAAYALANNCVRLDWTVERDNQRALEFYAGLGSMPAQNKLYFRVTGSDLSDLATGGAQDVDYIANGTPARPASPERSFGSQVAPGRSSGARIGTAAGISGRGCGKARDRQNGEVDGSPSRLKDQDVK